MFCYILLHGEHAFVHHNQHTGLVKFSLDTKMRHFRYVLPSQPFDTVLSKLNLTQQKQTPNNKPKDTTTQNKHKKQPSLFSV